MKRIHRTISEKAEENHELATKQDQSDTTITRSMRDFPDASTFQSKQEYPALRIPIKKTMELRKKLKHLIFRRTKTRNIYPVEDDPNQRILVLSNTEKDVWNDPAVLQVLEEECERTTYTINYSYEDLSVDEALKLILPAVSEIPSAFEIVGSLAHLNLRDEVLAYKYWIGQVILDKNHPRIRTVVNKLGTIETEYRTFEMEVIAGSQGKDWSVVTVKEDGCTFKLDFRKVYWNSRLAGEHKRIVRMIHKEAGQRQRSTAKPIVVADLMAGVGPFAVALAARGEYNVVVYANDLNPDAYEYLKSNASLNRCETLHTFNKCARAFCHQLQDDDGVEMDHVIMNLPASAPEFLDAFRGFRGQKNLPRIHVHCFAPKQSEANDYQDAVDRCSIALGAPLDRKRDDVRVHVVRDISPNKNMLCVSFRLPAAVREVDRIKLAEQKPESTTDDVKKPPATEAPAAKRVKTTSSI